MNINPFKHSADYLPVFYIMSLAIFQFIICFQLSLIWTFVCSLILLPLLATSTAYNHHQQHHPVFKWSGLNRVFEMVLTFQTGVISYGWTLHHVLGHHVHYLNQHTEHENDSGIIDEARWTKPGGRQMSFVEYSIKTTVLSYWLMVKVGLKHKKILKRFILYGFITLTLTIIGVLTLGMNFIVAYILVPVIVLFATIASTYKHHSGLRSKDKFHASYNIEGKFYNVLTCNLGYHTAHHLRPGLHWSQLPEYHNKIRHKIPPHLLKLYNWKNFLSL
ncbi:fatty acid desaturase [Shewanella surugensis]|uniref:Fatty acid desaturase n=1 Tax=Shewanella surugensis TaxID=212020 RepID=A0ABT0LKB6_9GAMM|nr:fatty acid desaturase [Shewanella surugensis]MCL1127737.1 fatty acid desaturase [Shewanella surugensis]